MKIARFSVDNGARFGVLNEETNRFHLLSGDPLYSGFEQSGQVVSRDEIRFVAPMLPRSKVIGFVQNFNCGEADTIENKLLSTYIKPNTSVIGPDVPITLPRWVSNGEAEVTPQLGLIISRPCKDVPESMVKDIIFGYMLVSAVGLSALAGSDPAKAYAFDTSCPSGPIIETGLPSGKFEFTFDAGRKVTTVPP
ncbi:fumarylacetoacetate hydrolase family protein [Arcanobacterium hippocoleae]